MSNNKRTFAEGHAYFITVVTHTRNPILIKNIELLRQSFRQVKNEFEFIIDAIMVL